MTMYIQKITHLQRYESVDHVRSTVRDSSMLLVITFEVFKMISVNVSSSMVVLCASEWGMIWHGTRPTL